MTGFNIGSKHVGDGAPCFIVGEIAQAHEGSLTLAHAYIDAIADSGADAVKMQCHIAAAESTPDEPWRVEPRWHQDSNRYDYWKRMEFTPEQWKELAEHVHSRGLAFIASPFSVEAVDMVAPLVDAWKIASGEIGHRDLLMAVKHHGIPVIVSTGMATSEEMARAEFGLLKLKPQVPYAFMHCVSEYPTKPGNIGLELLRAWREGRYRDVCPVGLSDHSGTIYSGLGAVALGCHILEVHVTFSREMQGFDTSSSITTSELRQLVEGVRFIEKAKQPIEKDAMAKELEPMRRVFMEKHERKENACR